MYLLQSLYAFICLWTLELFHLLAIVKSPAVNLHGCVPVGVPFSCFTEMREAWRSPFNYSQLKAFLAAPRVIFEVSF